MTGVIKIEIIESSQELLRYLKSAPDRDVKERVQALYWLKTHQVESVGAIASLIGKHRTTISRWLTAYRTGGLNKLLSKGKSTGRTSEITPQIKALLVKELQDHEGFSSYKEVQKWLQIVQDVDMSYSGVHKLVRYRLKSQLKVPRPTHIKQEKSAPQEFKKN